ncbi:MAG: hypothetical protein ABR499_13565 [Gemmatimonadaceae bacterium]
MRKMLGWALAAAILVGCITGVAGCGRAAQSAAAAHDVTALSDDGVRLRVQNNTGVDMKILVVDGGTWKSIGFAGAQSTVSFDVGGLNQSGAPLRILATPIGAEGAARSGPLTVLPGQTVTFTIEADLARSFAIIR